MASKAARLKGGAQDIFVSVDQLFETAFGKSPREYRHKSLLGWRPLTPDPAVASFRLGKSTPAAAKPFSVPSPGVKMFETDELIVVEVELPPIVEESLYLEISGDLLIIRGDLLSGKGHMRPPAHTPVGKKVYRYIQLPVEARPGEVRARLEGDTVRVTIRKQNRNDHDSK